MFWERFYYLCEQRGVKPLNVAHDLGVASGNITAWKRGRVPSGTTLQKIADYFNVSVDYLLGKQDEPLSRQVSAEIESTLSAEESEILKKLKQLDDNQAKQMLDYLEFLIQQRKKKE